MSYRFAVAAEKDSENLLALLQGAAAHLHKKGVRQWTEPFTAGALREDIIKNRVVLLFLDGHLAGSYALKEIAAPLWPQISQKQVGQFYLYRVVISPALQGAGLGKILVEHATKTALEQNKSVFLDCWAGNEALRRFYLSCGFSDLGVFPEEDYEIRVFYKD